MGMEIAHGSSRFVADRLRGGVSWGLDLDSVLLWLIENDLLSTNCYLDRVLIFFAMLYSSSYLDAVWS